MCFKNLLSTYCVPATKTLINAPLRSPKNAPPQTARPRLIARQQPQRSLQQKQPRTRTILQRRTPNWRSRTRRANSRPSCVLKRHHGVGEDGLRLLIGFHWGLRRPCQRRLEAILSTSIAPVSSSRLRFRPRRMSIRGKIPTDLAANHCPSDRELQDSMHPITKV